MLYIVTGFMRSGTSLMMHIMNKIGIEILYDKDREKELCVNGPSNPYFYEHPEYIVGKNITKEFIDKNDGKCIKVLGYGMNNIAFYPDSYKIIYMNRDFESRVRSICEKENKLEKLVPDFGRILWTRANAIRRRIQAKGGDPRKFIFDNYDVIMIDYDELIDNSDVTLKKLKEFLNIDFDIDKIKCEINSSLRKFVNTGLFDKYFI